eukprot:UN33993
MWPKKLPNGAFLRKRYFTQKLEGSIVKANKFDERYMNQYKERKFLQQNSVYRKQREGFKRSNRVKNGLIKSGNKELIIYNKAINECCKTRDWEQALQYLEEMKRQDMKPDVYTYTSCIVACNKSFEFQQVPALFVEMKENQIIPNIITYNAMINAYSHQGKWQEALLILKEIKETENVKPTIITYNSCLSACATGGQYDL